MTRFTATAFEHPVEDDIVDAFIVTVQADPDRFVVGKYTVRDTKSDVAFWTGNGVFFVGIYEPMEFGFSLRNKFRFWRWYKRLRYYHITRKLQTPA